MSPAARRLVFESWVLARPAAGALACAFYARLFEIDPGAAELFGATDMVAQQRKFHDMLDVIVCALELDDPTTVIVTSAGLARRHARYGLRDRHYDAVGEALLWALAATLDDAWTDDVRDAWREAYVLLASVMRRAAGTAC